MKRKIWILPVILLGGLSGAYFLPKGQTGMAAVKMELPEVSGQWIFKHGSPTQEELKALAPDTRFAKAVCLSPREWDVIDGEAYDRVDLSIVLSGYDLNNSIHRPERCMPAQGHTILSSSVLSLPMKNGRALDVKRLISTQRIQLSSNEANAAQMNCITYYFFVGHDQIVQDHLERTFIDMKDRLIRGMDQRWAYVSVSTWYGKLPWLEKEISEAEADKKLKEFLNDFSQKQILWENIRS